MKSFIAILLTLLALNVFAADNSLTTASISKQAKPAVVVKSLLTKVQKRQIFLLTKTEVGEDSDDEFDDMPICTSYPRPGLRKNSELSHEEYINLRLANARRLALEAYRDAWL